MKTFYHLECKGLIKNRSPKKYENSNFLKILIIFLKADNNRRVCTEACDNEDAFDI